MRPGRRRSPSAAPRRDAASPQQRGARPRPPPFSRQVPGWNRGRGPAASGGRCILGGEGGGGRGRVLATAGREELAGGRSVAHAATRSGSSAPANLKA